MPISEWAKGGSMSEAIYSRFDGKTLILRDELAIDRTLLANERTLLAYLRSSVALIIGGLTIIHFTTDGVFRFVGIATIPIGIATGIIGILRYRRMNCVITKVRKQQLAEQFGEG